MIEVEINGVTRGFKFGTYTFKLINELSGDKSIEDVFELLSNSEKHSMTDRINFLRTFYFACAQHYTLSKKQKVDFDEIEVSDWIDEMGIEKTSDIMAQLLKVYTDKNTKNVKAPETGLELQSSNGKH